MISASRIDKALKRRSFAYFKWRANSQFRDQIDTEKNFLLVYQMGKVGSSSVTQHLRNRLDDWEVFQIHTLTQAGALRVEERYRRASTIRSRSLIDRHILESRYLMRLLDGSRKTPLKTISMVRDPVARNISAFFQTFEVDFAQKYRESGEDAAFENIDVDELVDTFLFNSQQFRHEYPLVWFDEELRVSLGIDVYKVPFDHARGTQTYQNPQCDLLVMKMEDFSRALIPSVEAFLNVEVGEVQPSNTAASKPYSKVYRDFVESIRLPEEYLDKVYSSRFVRHFYSDDEIEAFLERWSK